MSRAREDQGSLVLGRINRITHADLLGELRLCIVGGEKLQSIIDKIARNIGGDTRIMVIIEGVDQDVFDLFTETPHKPVVLSNKAKNVSLILKRLDPKTFEKRLTTQHERR